MTCIALTRRGFVATSLAGAAAFGLAPRQAIALGRTLTVRMPGDIASIDPPFWGVGFGDFDAINLIHGKLINFRSGEDWVWEPVAAESIEQIDDTRTKFTLRRGLMWTNGYGEVTAEDVKYSFERYIDPDLEAYNSVDWLSLDHVEVLDKYTGVIVTKEYFAPLWWSVLPYSAGHIVCKRAVEEVGGKFTTDPPATCGPYKIEEWRPRERLTLVRHDGWAGPEPYFERIILVSIEDPKTAEKAFLAGELDFTHVSESSVPALREDTPPDANLVVRPSLDYYWLGINMKNPKYADMRVRKAIGKAIDVDAILDAAFFGAARRATSLIAPGMPGYLNISPSKPDIDGARRLMADAGLADGFDAQLEVLAQPDQLTAAQVIQANLAEIDINVTINSHDSGTFWSLTEDKGEDLEMTYKFYFQPPDPSWGTQWFLSEQAGIWNWEYFTNPEFDELHKRALAELDNAKRHKLYVQMIEIMNDSGCFVWIAHPPQASLARKTIEAAIWPNGTADYWRFRAA